MTQKIVVLDRDGVINEDSDDYVKSVDEWIPIPGSLEAIAQLKKAGYMVFVATNQSGIGRGLFEFEDFEAMCEKMDVLLDQVDGFVDGIFLCPHAPDDGCDCRKPKAGLLEQIEEAFSVSLKGAHLVGDSLRDLQAGALKECYLHLVKTGKGEKTLVQSNSELNELKGYANTSVNVHEDLSSFVLSV